MKKTKLINAIKKTIKKIEGGRMRYNWNEFASCNCGVLAQNLCGFSYDKLDDIFFASPKASSVWSNNKKCNVTKQPLGIVFKKLSDAGMTHRDIKELEYFSNKEVLKEIGVRSFIDGYIEDTPAEKALEYFRAWLRILEREEAKPEPEYRFIEKHSSVDKLLKEKLQLS